MVQRVVNGSSNAANMESKSGSHNKLELIKRSNVLSSSIEQAVYEKFANEHNLDPHGSESGQWQQQCPKLGCVRKGCVQKVWQ